jgi:hypothetical protein
LLYPVELLALADKILSTVHNIKKHFVGAAGFEPATSCSQSRRANRTTLRPVLYQQFLKLFDLSVYTGTISN